MSQLLELQGTVATPATTKPFTAKDQFRTDSTEVKFYGIWGNFTEWYLKGDGKVEEPQDEGELRFCDLEKNSRDAPIIAELGGEEKAETTLSELWYLLTKQPNGKKGDLLTNGYVNIFYIKDISGVLRAVRVDWSDDGWDVDADSVESPLGWNAGDRVFSRNS